jgi:late competence protein required for DNA uptake (superfamily II DNA/RNA helicase)
MKLLVFLKEKREKREKNGENCVFSSVNSSNFANILEAFAKKNYLKKLEKKTLNPMLLFPFLKTKSTYVIYTLIFLVMERPMEMAPITFEKLKKEKEKVFHMEDERRRRLL